MVCNGHFQTKPKKKDQPTPNITCQCTINHYTRSVWQSWCRIWCSSTFFPPSSLSLSLLYWLPFKRVKRQTVQWVCHIFKTSSTSPLTQFFGFFDSMSPTLLCLSSKKESNLKREYRHQGFHQRHILCLQYLNKHSCWFQEENEHDTVAQNLEIWLVPSPPNNTI